MIARRAPSVEESVVLSDGRSAVVRPMLSSDRVSLQALFDHTGADNLYTRFFAVGPATVRTYLDHLFSGDASVLAYLVIGDDRVLGVADVELLDAVSAEVALLVADDSHGRGIATLLLERAARDARSHGITWFVADVLAVNHLMLQVFTDIGFPVTFHHEGTEVTVRMGTELSAGAQDAESARVDLARAHRAVSERDTP